MDRLICFPVNRGMRFVNYCLHKLFCSVQLSIMTIQPPSSFGCSQVRGRNRAISQRNGLYISTHLLLKIDYVVIGSK